MNYDTFLITTNLKLSSRDFNKLSKYIHSTIGIKMPVSKKSLVEGRLRKRLRVLRLKNFSDYCDLLFSKQGLNEELPFFINAITTNKTDFFRESGHFDYLFEKAVPELISVFGAGLSKTFMLWSVASSTGNEAYSMAMILNEFAYKYTGFDFSILATDISTKVLKEAQMAIYPEAEIEPVPEDLKVKYFLKSKNRKKSLVRVIPALRSKVKFRQLNLMDENFKIREMMDIVFCRNVMIYFDKDTQDRILNRICLNLKVGGFLFMGHTEIIHNSRLPLSSVAPSVYKKVN